MSPSPAARRTVLLHVGDQRRRRTDSHGIINFSFGLARALPDALPDTTRLVVVANRETVGELGSSWGRPHDRIVEVDAPESVWRRLLLDHIHIRRTARAVGADVVLFPKGFLPVGSWSRGPARVVCFHDDIPFRQIADPRLSVVRRVRATYFAALARWSLRRADRRLFVSATTHRTLSDRSRSREDDAVIGEGISLPSMSFVPLVDRRPQAVVFGSSFPHKRVEAGLDLILADPACVDRLERVVVVGNAPTPRADPRLPVEHRPGPLDDDTVAALLASSRLLVFPSEHEGFGLPPIEAYASGTPAVFRRNDVARELLADVPGGYDDEDAGSFAGAAATALSLDDDDLRALREQMRDRFDWPTVAARVAEALAQA